MSDTCYFDDCEKEPETKIRMHPQESEKSNSKKVCGNCATAFHRGISQ